MIARKKPEIRFSAPEAGLSGQNSIKRTQKYVFLGVFGHFPKISKCPCAKNVQYQYQYQLLSRRV
jgi:hypothetical protein